MVDDGISYVGDTAGDQILDVTFYKRDHEGEEKDFIKIAVPGDKSLTIDTTVTEQHKRRFSAKWQNYLGMQSMTGTPIVDWSEIPEGLRREFEYQGFRFVEQVAGAHDAAFSRIMGGFQWRTKAQAFLNRGKVDESETIKQQAEMIAQLQSQMAQLLGNSKEAEPVKRGRKPKEE